MSSDSEYEYSGSDDESGEETDEYDLLLNLDDVKIENKITISPEIANAEFFAKEELNTISGLDDCQLKAIKYIVQESRKESEIVKPYLLQKFKRLGYGPEALERVGKYVKDSAPLIIHLSLDRVLNFLLKDTCYRNTFEVHSANNGARVQWEDRMFNNIYHNAKPHQRVKYGVLNVVGDPNGIKACSGYGDSYLLLRNVRLRTSFASGDTAGPVQISSCEYYYHVLNQYNDNELKAVIEVALGLKPFVDSSVITMYKEVQCHGDIRLNRDVEALVVAKRHTHRDPLAKNIETFSKRFNVPIIWLCDM